MGETETNDTGPRAGGVRTRWLKQSLYRKFLLTLLAVGLLPAAAGVALTATELWKVIRGISGDRLQNDARNIANQIDVRIHGFINETAARTSDSVALFELFIDPDAVPSTSTLVALTSSQRQDLLTSRPVYILPAEGPLRVFILLPLASGVASGDPQDYHHLEARSRYMYRGLKSVGAHSDGTIGRHVALLWLPVSAGEPDAFLGWIGVEIPVDRFLHEEVARSLFDVDEAWIVTSSRHLLALFDLDTPSTRTRDRQVIREMRLNHPAQLERAALLHAELSRFAAWDEGRFQVAFPDGTKQLVGFFPLPLTRVLRDFGLTTYGPTDADWYICIGRDMRPLANSFFVQLPRDVLAGVVLAAILAVLAYVFARRLARPIQALEKGVQQLAGGDLSSRVEIATGDELETLAHSFNEMATRIEEAARDLQQQMATVQRQSGELALVHDITRSINARLDLDQTLETFAREIARILSYDRLSVALLDDPEHFTIQFVYPEAGPSEFAPGTRHRLDESDLAEAVREGRPIVFREIDRAPASAGHEFLASAGLRSVMVVPLISENKAIGSVNLASRNPTAFRDEERQRMAVLAEPVAVAIQHSRLYMRVRRFAEELEAAVRRRTQQLRMAQDKLVQTEKLAAAGQLAAGIAHEINNPLGIIKNYLRLTMDRFEQSRTAPNRPLELQHLEIIEEELNRIARIVRNLLDLYSPRDHSPLPIDLNELLERILELFEPNWAKKGIDIIRQLEPSLPPLVVSSDRMRQIFINLLRNAEDAIEHRGVVALTTQREEASEESESVHVLIEVEDNGCGIAPDDLRRVFDPFFTTKKGGAGTGLGLSVTYGIIRSYGGTIDIDSAPGRGTRVTVRLPVSPIGAPGQPAPPAAEIPAAPAEGPSSA